VNAELPGSVLPMTTVAQIGHDRADEISTRVVDDRPEVDRVVAENVMVTFGQVPQLAGLHHCQRLVHELFVPHHLTEGAHDLGTMGERGSRDPGRRP